MLKAAQKLNIKPHMYSSILVVYSSDLLKSWKSDSVFSSRPGRTPRNGQAVKKKFFILRHAELLNRYYLLDFSRVFPPEAPIKSIKNAHLSRLLRAEFVSTYSQP